MIDRTLFRLAYKDASNSSDVVMNYVTDVISSGFNLNSFSLVPKFIGGAITLCIEFPTNYSDIFKEDATFKFECIQIMDKFVEGIKAIYDFEISFQNRPHKKIIL